MRMSCNGCRVLRKGCSENCSIRPCLQWIKSSESQSNATVFLAKFYGRAGLMNLINAGPEHLRPAIFKSLLYEACGRIVNPIYGSAGLVWSGNWQLCQTAVESVLKGIPIVPIASDSAACTNPPPSFKGGYDIRHVIKDVDTNSSSPAANAAVSASSTKKAGLHRVNNSSGRSRFKKSGGSSSKNLKPKASAATNPDPRLIKTVAAACDDERISHWGMKNNSNVNRSMSHDSSTLSHGGICEDHTMTDYMSMVSSQTAPLPLFVAASAGTRNHDMENDDDHKRGVVDRELELELTLGFHQSPTATRPHNSEQIKDRVIADQAVELRLDFS